MLAAAKENISNYTLKNSLCNTKVRKVKTFWGILSSIVLKLTLWSSFSFGLWTSNGCSGSWRSLLYTFLKKKIKMIFWPSNKQSSPTNNEIIMCCYLTNKSTSKFYWLNNLLVIIHVGHFFPSVECEFTSWVLVKGNIVYSVSLVVISDKDKRTQCYSNALQEHKVINSQGSKSPEGYFLIGG